MIYNDINNVFDINVKKDTSISKESRIDSKLGDGTYKKRVEVYDEYYKNITFDTDYNFKFYGKTDIDKAIDALQQIELLKTSETVLGMDVETLGVASFDNKIPSKGFAVNEISAVRWNTKTNSTEPVKNLVMGINESTAKEALLLYQYLEEGKVFDNDVAKAKLYEESAQVIAKRAKYNLGKGDENVAITRKTVVDSLNKLKSRPIKYNTKEAQEQVVEVYNIVKEAIESDIPLFGHNFKKADANWIDKTFKDHNLYGTSEGNLGLEPIDFSKAKVIDTLEILNQGLSKEIYEMYANANMGEIDSQLRLENLAKLTGVELDAHLAESDIIANTQILVNGIPSEGNKTLLQIAEENLRAKVNNYNTIQSNQPFIMYANKSVRSKEEEILDAMYDANGNGGYYKDYSTSRGVFYEFGGYSFTPKEELNSEMVAMLGENSDGAYSIKLNAVSGDMNFGHSSIITRGSFDELQAVMNNTLSYMPLDENGITYEYMKSQLDIKEKDSARRNFEAMFDPTSTKGFNYAESMYFSRANISMALGKDFNEENLFKLLKNETLEVGGRTLNLKEIAPLLYNSRGTYIPERGRDLFHLYDTIDDTSRTIMPALVRIKEKINLGSGYAGKSEEIKEFQGPDGTPYSERMKTLNKKRTQALKKFKNEVIEDIERVGAKINPSTQEANILSSNNYMSIKLNDEYINIDTTSLESTTRSLTGNLYRVEGKNTKTNRRGIIKSNVKIIANDLVSREILTPEQGKIFNRMGDPNTATKLLASMLYERKINEIKSNQDATQFIGEKFNLKPAKEYIGGMNITTGAETIPLDTYVNLNLKNIVNTKNNSISTELNFTSYVDDIIDRVVYETPPNNNLYFRPYSASEPYKKFIDNKIQPEYQKVMESIGPFLTENLGYTESHVSEVAARIIGENNSMMNNGMSVSIISYFNNTGDKEFGIVGFLPEDTESVQAEIERGVKPKNAIIQPLPNVNNHLNGNAKTIKMGYIEQKNATNVTSYIGDNGVVYGMKDVITESIQGPKKSYRQVNRLLEMRKFKEAQRLVEKGAKTPIYNASGASAFQTVSVNGVKYKKFVPKVADILSPVRADQLIHYLPELYANDENLAKAIDSSIGADRFKNFTEKLKKNTNATLSEATGSFPEIREWFKLNLLHENKLLEKIVSSEKLKLEAGHRINENVLNFYESLLSEDVSQINTKKDAQYLTFYMKRPEQYTPGSHLNNPRREQILQNLKSLPLLNQEIEENAKKYGINNVKKYFKNKKVNKAGPGILLGDSIRTYAMHNDYMIEAGKEFAQFGGVTTEMYGAIKQMNPGNFQIAIKDFSDNIESYAEEFKIKHGRELDLEVTREILKNMSETGTVHEQHSVIRPSIDRLFAFNDELKTVEVDETLIPKMQIGQKINSNTVISSRTMHGKKFDVKYTGQEGTVSFIDENTNKIFVDLDVNNFEEKKYIYHGFEKSMGSSYYAAKGKEFFDEGEFIYDKMFGESTMSVAYLPFAKHETGSTMVVPEIALLGELGKETSEKTQQKVIDLINNRMEGWKVSYATDEANKTGKVLLADIPYLEGNDMDSVKLLVKDIYDLADNGIDQEMKALANNYKKTLEYFKENDLVYGSLKRLPSSESLSYNADIPEDGKGLKYDLRASQIFGAFFTEDYITETVDGKFENVVEPIKDLFMSEVKKNGNYLSAEKELKSIYGTILAYTDEDNIKKFNVAEVTTADLMLPPSDLLNIETLSESVFKKFGDDIDFISVTMADQDAINPIKYQQVYEEEFDRLVKLGKNKKDAYAGANSLALEEARTNKVYIALGKPLMMDDNEIHYSKSMRSSAGIITDIQKLEELNGDEIGLEAVKQRLNNRISESIGNFNFEVNNKEGLVHSQMLSGRLDYSGSLLGAGMADMYFTDETGEKVLHPFSQRSIKIENGKPVYYDYMGVSKETILDMGLKDKTIANQILTERNFVDDKFIKDLTDQGYIKSNKQYNILSFEEFNKKSSFYVENPAPTYMNTLKRDNPNATVEELKQMYEARGDKYNKFKAEFDEWYYKKVQYEDSIRKEYNKYKRIESAKIDEIIANKYYREVGIDVIFDRQPLFHNKAMLGGKAILVDGLNGKTNILTEFLGKKFNGDIDGDKEGFKFLIEKDSKGRVRLKSRDDAVIIANEKIWKAQAKENEKLAKEKIEEGMFGFETIKGTDKKVTKTSEKEKLNFATSIDSYRTNILKMYGHDDLIKNANYYIREKSIQTAIKAMDNMTAIGNISVKNFLLRSMTDVNFDPSEGQDYRNLFDFTHEIEQNIISVKHDVDGTLTRAGMYADSLTVMAKSTNIDELNTEFENFVNVLNNSGVYDKGYKLPTAAEIISGKFDTADDNAQKVKSVYKIFTDPEKREAFLDPWLSSGHISGSASNPNRYKTDVKKVMDMIEQVNSGEKANTRIANDKIKIIQNLEDKVGIEGLLRSKEITGDHDIVSLVGKGTVEKGGNYKYVKLLNKYSGETKYVYGNNFNEIGAKLSKKYMTNAEFLNIFDTNEKVNDYMKKATGAFIYRKSFDMLTDYEKLAPSLVMFDLMTKQDKSGNYMFLYDEIAERAKDKRNFLYKTVLNNPSKKTKETINSFLDEFNSLSQVGKNKKLNDIYDTLSYVKEQGHDGLLLLAVRECDNAMAKGKLKNSSASMVLYDINQEIIDKGKEAKIKNNNKKEYIRNKIKAVAEEEAFSKQISKEINNLKIIGNESILKYREAFYLDSKSILENEFKELSGDKLIEFKKSVDSLYQDNIMKVHEYNKAIITKQNKYFAQAYNMAGGKELVLKWNTYTPNSVKSLETLSESKIGFGKYANLSYKDMSLEDLLKISNEASEEALNSPLIKESQKRINEYISITKNSRIKNSNKVFSKYTDTSVIADKRSGIIENVIDSKVMNEAILKRAEELKRLKTANKVAAEITDEASDLIKNSKTWYKNKYLIGAGIIAGVLGIGALATSGKSYINGGTVANKKNEDESYQSVIDQKSRPTVYQAPSSVRGQNKAVLKGMQMNVRAKAKNEVDKKSVSKAINRAVKDSTNNNVNVNYNEQDSREGVSDNWVKNKIADSIR